MLVGLANLIVPEPVFSYLNDAHCRPSGIFLEDPVEERAGRPSCTMHGRPPAVGHQLSLADKVFFHKVKRALEVGMLKYIPLDLLTDDAYCRAAREPPPPKSAFFISNGKLCLLNASFDVAKKSKLSFDD